MKGFLGRDGSAAQDHFGKFWRTSSFIVSYEGRRAVYKIWNLSAAKN